MKKAPSVVTVEHVRDRSITAKVNGKWVPARSVGFYSIWYRLKAAWGVFTGKYDALQWPEGQ